MMGMVDPAFAADFEWLIRAQGNDELDAFLRPIELFDEPPLYAHHHQLAFLHGLPVEEKNRQLIRAAAAHLPAIVEHGRGHDFYCMLSILGWAEFDAGDLVWPTFFYTNPSTRPKPDDPRGLLDYIVFEPPESRYSAFVADALDHDPMYILNDDFSTPYATRVYVRLDRYWSENYQTMR